MYNLTTTLEDRYYSIIQRPINQRIKRELFTAIGRMNKFLVGTMDDADKERLSSEITKLKSDSTAWKSYGIRKHPTHE